MAKKSPDLNALRKGAEARPPLQAAAADDTVSRGENLLESMPIGYLALTRDGVIRRGNPAGAKALGTSMAELAGVPLEAFLCPESRAVLLTMAERVAAGERGLRFETGLANRWIRIELAAGTDGCSACLTDITEGKDLGLSALVAGLTTNAVIVTDAAGYIEWVNDGFTRLTEFAKEEVVGKKPGAVLQGPGTDRRVAGEIRESVAAGRGIVAEILNYAKSGRPYWLLLDIQPIRSPAGELRGFIAVETDITKERLRGRLAADVAGTGFWELELASNKMVWDEGAIRILGFEPLPSREFGGWAERIHPEDRTPALLAGGEQAYRIIRPDGGIRHVRTLGAVVRNRMFGVLVDETARVRQREELRISEERLQMAALTIQMGVWELNASGPKSWDEGMLRVYGISRSEFEALSNSNGIWNKYVHADDLPRLMEMKRHILSSTGKFDIQFRIIRPDGEVRTLRSAGLASDDGSGGRRALGITMDITTEVRAAEKLREARDAAETANKAKSRFLATMSHEIRTPLNSVIGLANLLCDTPLNGVQQDYLNSIRTSGELLLAIVNDVLDLSKIEEGKLDLERIEFDLRLVVEEALDLVGEPARQKGLQLRIDFGRESPARVIGDPGRLKQVLLNLLSNAVKFTAAGSVTLEVRAESRETHDRYHFAVIDTGIGISEAGQRNLFQLFSQGDSSITRRFGGTGLGLAISERFVHLMEGEIGVVSRTGEGSRFWFTANFGRGTREFSDSPLELLQGRSALIVDADAGGRDALREQLQGMGMRVATTSSAMEALSICSLAAAGNKPYPVLLINTRMPVMNGWKLTALLRGQAGGKGAAIFLITDRLHPEPDPANWVRLEDEHFLKPVPRRLLVTALCKAFAPKPGVDGAAPVAADRDQRGRVLLVEDNRVNQKVAMAALLRLGYTVDVACDGLEALDWYGKNPYDLILMDCHMPNMDGFAATAAIREIESGRMRIPVIALTADVVETGRQRCLASGMDDFLSKPLQFDVLARALERWLNAGKY